jgi:hypothetical protein
MADQVRHKTFISYHHDDQEEVDQFIETFDHDRDVFIARAVGSDQTMDELIESEDDDYVMRRIREKHIGDSTVTLLFVGKNTWSRKFVDWELASSLHQGPKAGLPNGVLAILSPKLTKAILPDRFVDNWKPGYAKYYSYPGNKTQLAKWIDEAFEARQDEDKRDSIKNGRRKLRWNLSPSQTEGRPLSQPKSDGSPTETNAARPTAAAAAITRSAEPRKPYLDNGKLL